MAAAPAAGDLYIGRQLSWIAFNRRVLELALDESLPLLDRLGFLAISGENLDGFFMKRVAALQHEIDLGAPRESAAPLTAAEELAAATAAVREMQRDQARCLHEMLLPALAERGVRLRAYDTLDTAQRAFVDNYFEHELFPILTPLAVDPARPFPFISNLSLSLAVVLRHEDLPLFARVKVPANRPRFVRLPDADDFVPTEQIIAHHLGRLFRHMSVLSANPFRITRNADVQRDEAAADDLLDFAVDLVRERRFAPVVRLEIDPAMPAEPRHLLVEELGLQPRQVFEVEGLMGHANLREIAALDRPDLRSAACVGQALPGLPPVAEGQPTEPLFAALRERDRLVHQPYHAYDLTVANFVAAAARDPQVLAIKQSVYRSGPRSATLEALIRGAEAGKEVTALLELKARLDESSNISWAQRLESAGIHNSYGFVGFKTHTRMTLVVRQEPDGLRRYVHLSTGDYHDLNAREYVDLGLFTCAEEIAEDVTEFFNFLTGYSGIPHFRKLVVAPTDMRQRLLDHIAGEIAHRRAGRPARIVALMNALYDTPLSEALCEASRAGVPIDLIIRGECCLRPGVPSASETIRVRSVLGRFLEHSRVFRFQNGGDDVVYLGSADWMYRNLDHRIEVMVPVEDPAARQRLLDLLELYLADTAAAWELGADAVWRRVRPAPGEPPFSVQEHLLAEVRALPTSRP